MAAYDRAANSKRVVATKTDRQTEIGRLHAHTKRQKSTAAVKKKRHA